MKSHLTASVAMVVLFSAISACLAADEKARDEKGPRQVFDELDGNRDGRLTSDEVPGARRQFFERLLRVADKDGNGELTVEEFEAGLKGEPPLAAPPSGGPVGAGPGGGPPGFDPRQMFQRWDRNNNGKLSLDEFPEPMRERMQPAFERLGVTEISAEQFAEIGRRFGPGGPGGGGPNFQPAFLRRLDANGDGKLSRDEMRRAVEVFDELDTDKNGELDLRELMGGPGPMGFGRRPQPPGSGAPPASEKPGGARSQAPTQPPSDKPATTAASDGGNQYRRYDTDGDGRVSRDEAQGRLRKNFDRLDADGNGFLERDELRRALRERQPKKKPDDLKA
ncbi:MAG: hypothetical protein ACT4QC_02935 [Planctomycetaceae bacterium]